VSLLGDGLAVLAVPLLVLDLSRNPLVSALSAASVTVGYLVVGLPAGVLIDARDTLGLTPSQVAVVVAGAAVVTAAAAGWLAGLRRAGP
jgi:hypothetical protein